VDSGETGQKLTMTNAIPISSEPSIAPIVATQLEVVGKGRPLLDMRVSPHIKLQGEPHSANHRLSKPGPPSIAALKNEPVKNARISQRVILGLFAARSRLSVHFGRSSCQEAKTVELQKPFISKGSACLS
jgi:hypothetical protein